ncbi:hypothetical protein ERO13_D04G082216v2 [Gossypium hirsutum]|nr:hypothetical protein ERO13_D04G082216v2 [Gossypium hirsutum]
MAEGAERKEHMGIKGLTKLLADNAPKAMKEQKLESYFGRNITIDASMSIYQFLIVVDHMGTEMLTNEAAICKACLLGQFGFLKLGLNLSSRFEKTRAC